MYAYVFVLQSLKSVGFKHLRLILSWINVPVRKHDLSAQNHSMFITLKRSEPIQVKWPDSMKEHPVIKDVSFSDLLAWFELWISEHDLIDKSSHIVLIIEAGQIQLC